MTPETWLESKGFQHHPESASWKRDGISLRRWHPCRWRAAYASTEGFGSDPKAALDDLHSLLLDAAAAYTATALAITRLTC